MNSGVFWCVVVPCVLCAVVAALEGLIAARACAGAGRFVLPVLGGLGLLPMLCLMATDTGWDTIAWMFLAIQFGAVLAGSLLGLLIRRRREQKG